MPVPTTILAVATQAAILVLSVLANFYGLQDPQTVTDHLMDSKAWVPALQFLSLLALGLVLALVVILPATVALTRIQASLLDDAEDTIVPFDRSFGGKVVPEIVGGTGIVSILDALKTFEWSSRVRLLKAYAKVFAIIIAIELLFAAVLVGEIFLIAGGNPRKLLPGNGDEAGDPTEI